MNDLLDTLQSDELTESEAATLFGGGPAMPALSREEAGKAIRAAIRPDLLTRPDADKLILGWSMSIAMGNTTVSAAVASLNMNLADNYGEG